MTAVRAGSASPGFARHALIVVAGGARGLSAGTQAPWSIAPVPGAPGLPGLPRSVRRAGSEGRPHRRVPGQPAFGVQGAAGEQDLGVGGEPCGAPGEVDGAGQALAAGEHQEAPERGGRPGGGGGSGTGGTDGAALRGQPFRACPVRTPTADETVESQEAGDRTRGRPGCAGIVTDQDTAGPQHTRKRPWRQGPRGSGAAARVAGRRSVRCTMPASAGSGDRRVGAPGNPRETARMGGARPVTAVAPPPRPHRPSAAGWERSPRGCVDRSPKRGRRAVAAGGRGAAVASGVMSDARPSAASPVPPTTALQQTIASRTQEYGNSCRTFIVP